ncbi:MULTISPECIES: phasin family protein [Salinivibrio]|jgi:phasin family protein|uniref:Phasin family protein n=1 Tax=Salinivibrio costicola subsp. alcaliphilus TaxID=272773 RepID=A0ABX3KR26_SALCS|nr:MULTISPECIES: phasin family protein [Salinivibrio]NUY56810.1 phasin family protein [Salinivibrio sp. EAGSL]OOE92129.1 phasin family protein [Salinivibrio sp. AR640]OOE94139.1 phasin family protein [Salinivibrio sp. AR647]OOE98272.1 phasin family protein [Salinivibrio sp. MA351]OOE99637.1 phasin family protein [Salinivibrio sp. IB643]
MYTDMFKAFSEQSEKALAPYVNFNKLVAKNVETLTELQMNAMRTYSSLGLEQMKAASEVKDVTSMTSFSSQQLAALTKLSQQMMDDSTKLQNIAKEFKEDIDKITAENMKAGTPA